VFSWWGVANSCVGMSRTGSCSTNDPRPLVHDKLAVDAPAKFQPMDLLLSFFFSV